jgi:hypothetical protein
MTNQGKYETIRQAIAEAITGLVFSVAIALVVGGTAAMCLERAALFA